MKDQKTHEKSRRINASNVAVGAQRKAAPTRRAMAGSAAPSEEQVPSGGVLAEVERDALSDLLTAAISNLAIAHKLLKRGASRVKQSE